MNAMQRGIRLFRDSPSFGRDRANLWSGFTIGTTALLLNVAVLFIVSLMFNLPNDREFRSITERLGFGHILALIVLAGAMALPTLVIPLRLMTVFWGPRIGGYFDQIVLSGIVPFRFLIGKVTSQNLFLGLSLFLLLPYMVLSLTFGGIDLAFFVACIVLIWMYCMALALVTLWLALYFNELIAGLIVIVCASWLLGLGCVPTVCHYLPFTPAPFLVQPVHEFLPFPTSFSPPWKTFVACAMGMAGIGCFALVAIYLGPLYGVIRENSTFGEVVRRGDSRRKRWIRLRYHIQRPSELAFLYENRTNTCRRSEVYLRWGFGLLAVTALAVTAHVSFMRAIMAWGMARRGGGFADDFHVTTLFIQGAVLLVAAFVFSHNKNTTLLRLPVTRSKTVSVARLDTIAFGSFVLLSALIAIGMTHWFEWYVASPAGWTLFPTLRYGTNGPTVDYFRTLFEGCAVLSLSALVLYALHRLVCLYTWMKSPVLPVAAAVYFFSLCLPPFILAIAFTEIQQLRESALGAAWGPSIAMVSPMTVLGILASEVPSTFPVTTSTVPFYAIHVLLLTALSWAIVRRQYKLQPEYLRALVTEATP